MIETNPRKPMTTIIPSIKVLGASSLPINRKAKHKTKGRAMLER